MSTEDASREVARQLLDRAGRLAEFVLTPIPGGRNNRVWKIHSGDADFLLKQYYWTENDTRDRMGHEWAFLAFLNSIGSTAAAKPIEADRENRFALLEFIHGATPKLAEVSAADIDAACQFFAEMNAGRFSSVGRSLPIASEACFSLEEHVETTARRILRLNQIVPAESPEAHGFVTGELLPLWQRVRTRIADLAQDCGGYEKKLEPAQRCLSPSDFGFHNSLRPPAGRLRFVDFEYAGWDDPAKTISDFANQPDMLLDASLSDIFRERAIAFFPDSDLLTARLRLLTPLYQIKWACICLNEFLPSGSIRRAFTGLKTGEGLTRLAGHLERARIMAARAAKSLDFPDGESTVSSLLRPSS